VIRTPDLVVNSRLSPDTLRRAARTLENGMRPIGTAMAKRLGTALGVGYKVFL